MRRRLQVVSYSTILVICLLGLFFAKNTYVASAHEVSGSPLQPKNAPIASNWIMEAEPYVHVSNFMATIDPSITLHLSTEKVALVKNAVLTYNQKPLAMKELTIPIQIPSVQNGSVQSHESPNAVCPGTWHTYILTQWYGWQWFLNECDTKQLELDDAIPGGIGVTVFGICALFGPPGLSCAAVAAAIAGFITLNIAVMAAMDHACGNQGIQMNVPWSFAGSWFWYIC